VKRPASSPSAPTSKDVDVTRSNRKSVTFTFGAEALGSPEHFKWQVWVWELPELEHVCDKAPNRGWVRE
jgi:hypothetical protein